MSSNIKTKLRRTGTCLALRFTGICTIIGIRKNDENGTKEDLIMNNEVLKAMKTRRSIRKYKPEQITDEQLDAILEAEIGRAHV